MQRYSTNDIYPNYFIEILIYLWKSCRQVCNIHEISRINDNKVTVAAGLSNGILGKAKNSTHDLSAQNISKLLLCYRDINARWLMTGEGEMLLPESNSIKVDDSLSQLLTMFKEKDAAYNLLLEQLRELERENIELKTKLEGASPLTKVI